MKRSIAYKVTARVSVILLLALAILFAASFLLVRNIIYDKTEKYAEATLNAFTDMLLEETFKSNTPLGEETSEIPLRIGDYICQLYDVDFAYLFLPLEGTEDIRYLCVAQNDRFDKTNPYDRFVGKLSGYALTADEWAVWNGEKTVSRSITESKSGHEISTMLRIEDVTDKKIMAGVDISYESTRNEVIKVFSFLAVIILLVIVGVNLLVYSVIRRNVSRPAEKLSRSMTEFITDGKYAAVQLPAQGSDEYAMIANAYNRMTENIRQYTEDIGNLTRDRERRQAEMDIAATIQKGFLPKEFLTADAYEVRASMQPAKDVGGDFYSYLPLDSDRVFTVIADVSGKGVTAALFMSVTLTLTVQYAKMGLSPAQILQKVNEALVQNNPTLLFATAFVGIYDSRTGKYTYANAGHNAPYVILCDGVRRLDGTCGTLLGLFEGEEYTEQTVSLQTGDTVFLYTDGVTEATDAQNAFFGEGRLEETLRQFRASHAYNPIAWLRDSLAAFVGDSEQHDDITVLTLNIKKTEHLSLDVQVSEFERIKETILALPLPRPTLLQLCLCAEEWFVNICSYAFPDGVPAGEKIDFELALSDRVTMVFRDGGLPFNPLEHVADIESYDMDAQLGGLGNFITVSSTDDIFYEYKDKKNVLTMIRFTEE